MLELTKKTWVASSTWISSDSGRPVRALLSSILEQLDRPVLVLGRCTCLSYANDCGTEFLRAETLLRLSDERVVAVNPKDQKYWRQGLEHCRDGGRHLLFFGYGRSGQAISVCSLDPTEGGDPMVLAIVGGAPSHHGGPLAAFGSHFQLTNGEMEVLRQLLANRKPIDIARERQRSLATVRAQIQSLLAKTECSSISDLLLSVSRLPPVRTKAEQLIGPTVQCTPDQRPGCRRGRLPPCRQSPGDDDPAPFDLEVPRSNRILHHA